MKKVIERGGCYLCFQRKTVTKLMSLRIDFQEMCELVLVIS